MSSASHDGLERLTRPLLELVQRLTGLETSFVTHIDWDTQLQEVMFALNTAELEVKEGGVINWNDSMCRLSFLSGKEHTAEVATEFPESLGGKHLGMQTFFAVPILMGEATLGTVCGASRRSVEIAPAVMEQLHLIARAIAFQLASVAEAKALRERAERAEALARTDSLTGLANRRELTARLEEELARAGRHGAPIALVVIDIDHFKAVNDTFGHLGGDTVLRVLGEVLVQSARIEDVAARLGGDEFALLLPGTGVEGAHTMAARISELFQTATTQLEMPCTLSIGISTNKTTALSELLAAADDALYLSKAGGRDHVEVAGRH